VAGEDQPGNPGRGGFVLADEPPRPSAAAFAADVAPEPAAPSVTVQKEGTALPVSSPPIPGGGGSGWQRRGGAGSGPLFLADFSDEELERELAARKRGGGGGGGGVDDACGQDGGVCVPCFEIV